MDRRLPASSASTDGSGRVDVGRAVRCIFRQEGWGHTLLMGTLFMFIPAVGPIALQGYAIRIFKHLVVTGDDRNLPPLAGFGELLHLGIVSFLMSMLYMFPIFFLVYTGIGLGVLAGVLVVAGGAAALAALGLDPGLTAALTAVLAVLVVIAVLLVVYAFTIAIAYPLQAVHTMVEITGKIEYAWKVREVLAYIRFLGPEYRRAFVGMFFSNLLIMMAGTLLCYFGIFPAAVVVSLAAAHMRAQLYRIYLARGGTPLPMDPRF